MDVREADDTDTERIRELARSTMTAAYALNPQQLDTITRERFEGDSLDEAIDDTDTVVLVAEDGDSEATDETIVVGFVEGRIEDDRGDLRWLFVDPEHRGMGVGTRLYEAGSEALRENGAEVVTASVLEANTEGGTFFERLGLERADEREIEIGGESFVEYVYADPETVDSSADGSAGEADERDGTTESDAEDTDEVDESETEDVLGDDLPGTETSGDATLATTDDGTETYLDREEVESGTEGPFVVTYTDEDLTDRYGYYCSSCGSLDTAVGESEHIECTDCGNSHTPRSAETDDDSYL